MFDTSLKSIILWGIYPVFESNASKDKSTNNKVQIQAYFSLPIMIPLIIIFSQSNHKTSNIAKPKPPSLKSIKAKAKENQAQIFTACIWSTIQSCVAEFTPSNKPGHLTFAACRVSNKVNHDHELNSAHPWIPIKWK